MTGVDAWDDDAAVDQAAKHRRGEHQAHRDGVRVWCDSCGWKRTAPNLLAAMRLRRHHQTGRPL